MHHEVQNTHSSQVGLRCRKVGNDCHKGLNYLEMSYKYTSDFPFAYSQTLSGKGELILYEAQRKLKSRNISSLQFHLESFWNLCTSSAYKLCIIGMQDVALENTCYNETDPTLVFYPPASKMSICICSLRNVPVSNPTWWPLPGELWLHSTGQYDSQMQLQSSDKESVNSTQPKLDFSLAGQD